MFVIDDLFAEMLGLDTRPFNMLWIMKMVSNRAYSKKYNLEKIQDQIKENQMLYEFGEIEKKEFESRKERLFERLSAAKQVRKMYGQSVDMRST